MRPQPSGRGSSAAYFCAESGDVVTLSPACAAFDCYANFMERGRAYKEMVKKLGE